MLEWTTSQIYLICCCTVKWNRITLDPIHQVNFIMDLKF